MSTENNPEEQAQEPASSAPEEASQDNAIEPLITLASALLDIERVRIVAADAGLPDAWWDGRPYDRILADVPCTASGVVRRHPDAKWLRRESDITAFARAQTRLLEALWPLLARLQRCSRKARGTARRAETKDRGLERQCTW